MKIKLGQKIYDTEKAEEVGRRTAGYFGDTTGFEEILFLKGQKEFFLFARGGSESQYVAEQIIPMKLDEAKYWLESVAGLEYAASVLSGIAQEKNSAEPAKKPAVKKAASKAKAEPKAGKS